jgi:hypothetical protein
MYIYIYIYIHIFKVIDRAVSGAAPYQVKNPIAAFDNRSKKMRQHMFVLVQRTLTR